MPNKCAPLYSHIPHNNNKFVSDNIVRPLGMCGFDMSDEEQEEQIISVGDSVSGKIFKGSLNHHGIAELPAIIGTGKKFAEVRAIIDTGAYYTSIRTSIAEGLGAWKKGISQVSTPDNGIMEVPFYMMSYHIGDKNVNEQSFVSDVRGMNFEGIDMIIGTQFLTQFCDFRYYGLEKKFELIFK